ncbi:MAG: DnaJ C-terminal domain-containing protein, partial [Amylibacter sp.]
GKTRITLPDGGMLDVKIPQGTADQQTIRLRGKGGPGFEGGPAGDALVNLTVHPHTLFRREGNDILITLPITLDEAVLGGKVETPTIEGAVKLNIPKGASSGQVLRMRGRGVKPAGKPAGDQRVELRIIAPDKIDTKLEEFMGIWRKTNAYDPRKGMKI